jgi:hypothetical protein
MFVISFPLRSLQYVFLLFTTLIRIILFAGIIPHVTN